MQYKYSKKYYESILDLNNIEQSIVESINNVKKKFIESSLSHLTRMQRMKSDVNQYANQCEPFQLKNIKFCVEKSMSSYFKYQAWSIYKQATEAETTEGWWG